jgi:hypothetical protein
MKDEEEKLTKNCKMIDQEIRITDVMIRDHMDM